MCVCLILKKTPQAPGFYFDYFHSNMPVWKMDTRFVVLYLYNIEQQCYSI